MKQNFNLNSISNFMKACLDNKESISSILYNYANDTIDMFKKGNKIHIKKENKGKFTEYCNGKVTSECILRGKNSLDPKIRKRATFANNARHFKHKLGGVLQISNPDMFVLAAREILPKYFNHD